jgi:type VI secretion system protein ImpH
MGLLGLRSADSPLSLESLLPFAGPLALAGHSGTLLETLVAHQFDGVRTRVEEFVPRRALVDEAQQCRLGVRNTSLGDDWVLGARVPDLAGKFRLWMGPLGLDEYRGFLPGQPNRHRLSGLVDATIRSRLEYEVVLILHEEDIPPWRLGHGAELGFDAWLAGGDTIENVIVTAT